VDLPVDVAHADLVQVHERQVPDTCPRQSLGCPASDAAYSDDANSSVLRSKL
jgi:hypothetical protein